MTSLFFQSNAGVSIIPHFSEKELIYTIESHFCTVVVGQTGSGKSTKIPQFLIQAGYCAQGKQIALTLPRRVAVLAIADRIAFNTNTLLGEEIGYQIRFDSKCSKGTKAKIMTDGMMIQEILKDPLLTSYSVIVVDDCHERSINTDLLLGLIKKISKKRKDLKLVVSSATIDAQAIASFFKDNNVAVFGIPGRMHPVEINYLKETTKDYIQCALLTCFKIHRLNQHFSDNSDILVFLPGQDQIHKFMDMFEQYSKMKRFLSQNLFCVPLFAGLSMDKQLLALKPPPINFRKIIVSTNVAETSITIHGVAFVVDTCFTKLNFYDPATDMENLITIPASQANCEQRAGRAGRLKPGKCYRLCTKEDFDQRLPLAVRPEIQRANLTQLVLLMKALGITNIVKFKFLTPPNHKNLARAVENLYALKILDDECELTKELGYPLADAPFDPRILIALMQSVKDQQNILIEDVLDLAGMLSIPNLFLQTNDLSVLSRAKKKAGVIEGDHITLLNMLNLYRGKKGFGARRAFCKEVMLNPRAMEKALEMRKRIGQFCHKKLKIKLQRSTDDDDAEGILKCILAGFFSNVAQKQPDGSYRNIRQMECPLYIHPASVLALIQPHWVVYHEILCTHKNYMKEVSTIQPEWLLDVAPHFYVDHKKAQLKAAHVQEAKKLQKLEENEKQSEPVQMVGLKRKGFGQGAAFKRKKISEKKDFTVNSFPKFPGLKGQGAPKADFDDEL